MKVIFLDIDGVLNSMQSCIGIGGVAYDYEGLDRTAVGMLREMCEITGAKIVVSSTWRNDGADVITGALAVCGWRSIVYQKIIIGVTDNGSGQRGDQIQRWLEATPSCENYIIIDDDSDMLDSQKEHFVHTDGVLGFNMYDMVKGIDILGALPDATNTKRAKDWKRTIDFKLNKRKDEDHGYTL